MPALPPSTRAEVDHLVVLAADLAQGVAWCEATLGVTPAAGGKHASMGTHNRLLNVAGDHFPDAYLEIIAIDSEAACARPAGGKRWFDMDSQALQAEVAAHGPRLVHWVARVPCIADAVAALAALGIDAGEVLEASRMTLSGELRWRIAVRRDGRRLFDGALPSLIEWGGSAHPARALPACGLALGRMGLRHPQAELLAAACASIGLESVPVEPGAAQILAQFAGPGGMTELHG